MQIVLGAEKNVEYWVERISEKQQKKNRRRREKRKEAYKCKIGERSGSRILTSLQLLRFCCVFFFIYSVSLSRSLALFPIGNIFGGISWWLCVNVNSWQEKIITKERNETKRNKRTQVYNLKKRKFYQNYHWNQRNHKNQACNSCKISCMKQN